MSVTIDPDENLVQVPTPVGFEARPEGAAAEILTACRRKIPPLPKRRSVRLGR